MLVHKVGYDIVVTAFRYFAGGWIIIGPNGEKIRCSDRSFKSIYAPV